MGKTILFDLDGTLTDPGEGITNSVAYALKRFGISAEDRRALYGFIGPPLNDSFMRYYGFTKAEADRAVEIYREYFAVRGLYENAVYPGVPEMLDALRARGRRLIVATSKPEVFSRRILERFGLWERLDGLFGNTLDDARHTKGAVIRCALESLGVSPSDAVMVGDREHDVLGARENGTACVGVLYGYGSREELEAAGAQRICATVEELRTCLESV